MLLCMTGFAQLFRRPALRQRDSWRPGCASPQAPPRHQVLLLSAAVSRNIHSHFASHTDLCLASMPVHGGFDLCIMVRLDVPDAGLASMLAQRRRPPSSVRQPRSADRRAPSERYVLLPIQAVCVVKQTQLVAHGLSCTVWTCCIADQYCPPCNTTPCRIFPFRY